MQTRPILSLVILLAFFAGTAVAQTGGTATGRGVTGPVTGLPLPRYVSLKADRVNVRRGPSRAHAVEWVFRRRGMPVEVVAEFENWRRIRDVEGDTGWIHHALLDGDRTALIIGRGDEEPEELYPEPGADLEPVALAEPGVVAKIEQCIEGWCQLRAGGYSGWIERELLYGVYPRERIE